MVIFLDIDGVMVPIKSWEKTDILTDGFSKFSESSIKALNKLLTEETKVILTTSHRFSYSIGEWKDIFKKREVNISNIEILPFMGNNRKNNILEWFENNDSNDYLIIDDDKSLNDLPLEMKEKLILTSPMIGLI